MDRFTQYPAEIPTDTDILNIQRSAYEGLGQFALDILGATTAVARLACTPTTIASSNVKVGPGSIYMLNSLEASLWGGFGGAGGLPIDANADHQILKQGLHRDTETLACPPPGTAGQSINYLIQARFVEADDAGVSAQYFNPDNVTAPFSRSLSPARRNICQIAAKPGTAAATGSQTTPGADGGWVPVWSVVSTNGAVIVAGQISAAAGAPFVSVGGGGGGGGVTLWQNVSGAYTALAGDKLIADTSGGAFTITLPAAPVADSAVVRVKVNGATNNLTIGRNGHNFAGFAGDLVINSDFVDVTMVYDGALWRI